MVKDTHKMLLIPEKGIKNIGMDHVKYLQSLLSTPEPTSLFITAQTALREGL